MNKTVVGLGVLALLAIAAAMAFFTINGAEDSRSAVEVPLTDSPATSSETPVLPALPTPSLNPGSEDAERLMEINRIVFEVTQEAIARPKEDRMTREEIDALIRSRIEELDASP